MHVIAAIIRPFTSKNKLLFFTAILAIPFVNVVSTVFFLGYVTSCAESAMKKRYALPIIKDPGLLFLKGLFLSSICIIYILPAYLLGLFIHPVVQGVFVGLAVFLLPEASLLLISSEQFTSALKIGRVIKKAVSAKYLLAWLLTLIVGAVVLGLAAGLSLLVAWTIVIPLIVCSLALVILFIAGITIFSETKHQRDR